MGKYLVNIRFDYETTKRIEAESASEAERIATEEANKITLIPVIESVTLFTKDKE